jgi:hypothetical protein
MQKMPFQVSQRRVQDLIADYNAEVIAIPEHQRPYVWDAKRGSAFIDTIMKNLPTHAIFLYQKVVNGEIKRFLEDGQQRFLTIVYFVTGNSITQNVKWNTKRFADMSVTEQNTILNYMITVNLMENIDQTDRIMLFQRLQDGKALTSGQRFSALLDRPLVRLANSIINNERCHAIWGNHRETKSKTVLANAIAIAAGLALTNDNHITTSYEIIGPVLFENPTIDNDLATHRLEQLLDVYKLADELVQLTATEKKKQWKVGLYNGYILYTMRQQGRDWEHDKRMWVDYIVRVRREPSAILILQHNAPASRNWTRERWEQGLQNIENQERVLEQIRTHNTDSSTVSDEEED